MEKLRNRFFEFGEFRLDTVERTLFKNGLPVEIHLKTLDILIVLVEHNGQLVGKDELMNMVWGDTIVEEGNLKNRISLLRKALDDPPDKSHFIQTMPRRGYKFIAPVISLPNDDSNYLIEKYQRADISVDEIEEDNQIDTKVAYKSLPVANRDLGFLSTLKHNKTALTVFALVVIIFVGTFLLYRLFANQKPKFSFDKMKITKLNKPGHGFSMISPDGKYLAYEDDVGLWVKAVNVENGRRLMPRMEGATWSISFSKDSSDVFYTVANEKHPNGIAYQISILGGQPRVFLENKPGVLSPDFTRLLFNIDNRLTVSNLERSDEKTLITAGKDETVIHVCWSKDGRKIYYSSRPKDRSVVRIFEISVDGGVPKALGKPIETSKLIVSPFPDDGGLLLIILDETTGLRQLWFMSQPDGELQRITNDSNDYWYGTVTEDGKAIFAYHGYSLRDMWVADVPNLDNANNISTRASDFEDVRWTTDNRLLFTASESGQWGKKEIWIINPDSTQEQKLTHNGKNNRSPFMSLDGRYIVYRSISNGLRQIFVMDSNGRNERQITSESENMVPGISYDNKWVLFVRNMTDNICKVPIEGGASINVTDDPTPPEPTWAMSPDGKFFAYIFLDEKKKQTLIGVKSVEGGDKIKVYDAPEIAGSILQQWTNEGLLISTKDNQIMLLPHDGSKAKKFLTHDPKDLISMRISQGFGSYRVSPDGKRIVYITGTSALDAVLITGFK